MARPRRIAFLGNCQVQSFANLARFMIEDVSTLTFDYSTPAAHDEAEAERFADQLDSCDLIFTQRASERFRFTNDIALRARFPGKTIIMGNFYFRGLFPDSCYVGAFGARFEEPTSVNSVILLDAFRRGLTVDAAARALCRIDDFERLGLLDAWRTSMDEMRRREAGDVLDVPAAEMMEAACRRYPAFLTMNHPSVALLSEYLESAFRFADVAYRPVNAGIIDDPLAHHDTTPILDAVAEHYGLPYRAAQRWKINSLDGRFIDGEELTERFYAAYAGAAAHKLLVHSPADMIERLGADPSFSYLIRAEPPEEEDAAETVPDPVAKPEIEPEPTPLPETIPEQQSRLGIVIAHRRASTGPRRILLTKLDHFGDFIMALPTLEQLRRDFPRDMIRLICGPWNESIARATKLFDEIRCYSFFPENALGWSGEPVDSLASFMMAAEGHFDIAIDVRVDADTRHLLAHVDADLRAGIGNRGTFPFLDIVLPSEARGNFFPSRNEGLLGPERFQSQMPIRRDFYHETDFSITDRYIIDGPGVRLPSGKWRVIFGLEVVGPLQAAGVAVLIEVTRDSDTLVERKFLKRRRQIRLPISAAVIEFENEHADARFDFRVHTDGRAPGSRLRFSGVCVAALTDGGDRRERARLRPAELHIGEQLSLLVGLVSDRVRDLYASNLLPGAGISGAAQAALDHIPAARRRILVAPFSNSDLRTWPAAHFGAVIDRLLATPGTQIVLSGSPAQADHTEAIRAAAADPARVFNLAGKTRWQDIPAILRSADLVICNNSGVAHLAAAHGVRVLAIYSGSHQPQEWGPRGGAVTTMMAEIGCSPCGFDKLSDCTNEHRCMWELLPEKVAAQAEAMLAQERQCSFLKKRTKKLS